MESYCLSIHSNEDFDLIEDYEEREEAASGPHGNKEVLPFLQEAYTSQGNQVRI